jgi:hypothetical protein
MTRTLPVVLAAFVLSGAVAAADSRIQYKSTEGSGTAIETILVGSGRIRSDSGTQSVIIAPADNFMLAIDHSRKTFMRMTKADLEAMAKSIGEMMKQMEAALANMPPEMRGRAMGMMRGGPSMQPSVTTDTGETATVGGKSCRIFRRTSENKVLSEYCLANPASLGLPAADQKTLAGALAFMEGLMKAIEAGPLGRVADATPFHNGMVPLRTTQFEGTTRRTSEFVSAAPANLPAATFDVPEGYKEEKMPTMGGRGRGRGGLQ